MKMKVLSYMFYGIIVLNIMSCVNKTESKSEITTHSETALKSNNTIKNQTEFVYSRGNKKVELIFENDAKFLVLGESTKVHFKTENINPKRFVIVGPGILIDQAGDKDGIRCIITPVKKTLVDGNLEVRIREMVENGEHFTHKFLVPVLQKPKH
nr:hypothetical protein [uncultured Psychroserpens sp.]